MRNTSARALLAMTMGVAAAGTAHSAVVLVGDPSSGQQPADQISVSTTWTSNNVYRLKDQIYVMPGATLTIQASTVIASINADQGSLAVTRGARIFINGTKDNPVIMTSTADVATWAPLPGHPTGKDPKTGTWREAANEWGNLTIMGRAYISNGPGSHQFVSGNTAAPNANNVSPMEGLVAAFPGDPNVLYGGGNDDDDSGSISYLSIRYTGKVIGLNNELNGLSLGGVGRATDIHHVDIMNNVDDGIEIWGGTVNLKYVNIWNIGDDSFDIDQGWRGKAQFGLLVQGYSLNPSTQGGGVGDNLFETDGGQDSDCQPVTTAVIYNFTAIGQPVSGAGDHGTAWRDNARVQYRNCIFMDLGERLVSFDNIDGDGSHGYGFNGTLSWANTWATNFSNTSTVDAPPNPAAFYTAQTSGRLAEIRDSVFFRNLHANAYTEANNVTVFNANFNNVLIPGFDVADAPIRGITRGPVVTVGGTTQLPVISLDPRAQNEAETSVGTAPDDDFFTPVQYRGAFSHTKNWLCGWTAANAFGFTTPGANACNLCAADVTGNLTVNIDDLLGIISHWGQTGVSPYDINQDLIVNIDDLLAVVSGWGSCP